MDFSKKIKRLFLSLLFFLLFVLGMYVLEETEDLVIGILFLYLSLITSPLFDKLESKLNIKSSKKHKKWLYFSMFLAAGSFYEYENLMIFSIISPLLVIIGYFYILIKISNRNAILQLEEKEKEKIKKEKQKKILKESKAREKQKKIKLAEQKNLFIQNLSLITHKEIYLYFNKLSKKSDYYKFEYSKSISSLMNNIIYIYDINGIKGNTVRKKEYESLLPVTTLRNSVPFKCTVYDELFKKNVTGLQYIDISESIPIYEDSLNMNKNELRNKYNGTVEDYKNVILALEANKTLKKINELLKLERLYQLDLIDNDLITIIKNLYNEFSDINFVYKNSEDIFTELYQSKLGIESKKIYKHLIKMVVEDHELYDDLLIENITVNNFEAQMKSLMVLLKERQLETDAVFNVILLNFRQLDFTNLSYTMNIFNMMPRLLLYYENQVNKYNAQLKKERLLKGNVDKEINKYNLKYKFENLNDGFEFEELLVDIFKKLEYKVYPTKKSGDQGADLVVSKFSTKYVIQAKYYSQPVGNTAVQEVIGAINYYKADKAVVITNNSYTKSAISLAIANNVILIDGRELDNIINNVIKNKTNVDVFK